MHRVGDVEELDRREIHGLARDGAAVGRPPEAAESVHLLLRHELRQAMGERVAPTLGQTTLTAARDVGHVEIGIAHAGHLGAVGRKLRIDGLARGRARELDDRARFAFDHEHAPREGDQDPPAVLRELIRGDAARRLALTLAARALLGRELLLRAAQDAAGGEQHAFSPCHRVEGIEILDEAARTRAQEQHGIARGGDTNRGRLPERKVIGRGVLIEERAVGIGDRPRRDRRRGRQQRERERERQSARTHQPSAAFAPPGPAARSARGRGNWMTSRTIE